MDRSKPRYSTAGARATDHHDFWPCDVSLLDPNVIDSARLHGLRQVTGAYLLALAVAHDGRFVTFDGTVSVRGVVRDR